MACKYCPEKFLCPCPPKCEKCNNAAKIYRDAIQTLHETRCAPILPKTYEMTCESTPPARNCESIEVDSESIARKSNFEVVPQLTKPDVHQFYPRRMK
ncbi:Hypothetical predicted protein [Paramuricea clavata]|uniref:Uncharacterized protein n=1 Tax=Paramuricea clavata TaxID=317549 RepID=A0A7D9DZ17_PARCT|nr:Hypothetical predicted protein [Paramuricea clavata]